MASKRRGAEAGADARADLLSGDPSRQAPALAALLAALAAGRDAAPLVSAALAALLGNATARPELRAAAYDLAAAAQLGDADWAAAAAGAAADLARGAPPELRARALGLLPALPGHHLERLLADAEARARLSAALRSAAPAVRAAAVEALAEVAVGAAGPAAAAAPPDAAGGAGGAPVLDLLREAADAAADALVDADDGAAAAGCAAVAALLRAGAAAAAASAGGEPSAAAAAAVDVRAELARRAGDRLAAAYAPVLARLRRLPLGLAPRVPPLLSAFLAVRAAGAPGAPPPPLGALPGDAGGGAHAADEAAALLGELLRRGDGPLVLAAAEALLQLAALDGGAPGVQALLPAAVAAAEAAARGAGPARRPVALPAVLALLLRHLGALPGAQRALLLRRLPPMIAAEPAAAERTHACLRLWLAAAQLDWAAAGAGAAAAAAAAAAGRPPPPAPPTIVAALLADPALRAVVAGAAGRAPGVGGDSVPPLPLPHPRFSDPHFREELVGALLHALLTHARPAAAFGAPPAAASGAAAAAAAAQARAEAADWLGTSAAALAGAKACLGWDRVAGVAATGAAAVPDLWLRLLLRCLRLADGLEAQLDAAARAAAKAGEAAEDADAESVDGADAAADADVAASAAELPTPAAAAAVQLRRRVAALGAELQGLLLVVAANWRALHPAVRARAVWVATAHLRLKSIVDSAWSSLADAVHGLLSEARAGAAAADGAPAWAAAAAEGALAPGGRAGGAGAAAARRPRYEAAVAAGAGEAADVALTCLERLAGLVAHNDARRGGKVAGRLAPLAGLLDRLAAVAAERDGGAAAADPAAAERLARVRLVLAPALVGAGATGGKAAGGAGGGHGSVSLAAPGGGASPSTAAADAADAPPVVVDLAPDPAAPPSAAYPSTLPASPALAATPEALRYRALVAQLAAASLRAAGGAGGAASPPPPPPAAPLPSLRDLAAALGGGAAEGAVEVTGPSAPLALAISHTVDPGAGAIRLRVTATNRTRARLAGAAVTLLPGGPAAAAGRRPLAFRLEPLGPGEAASWEVALRVAGFGWPVVQPGVSLPITAPGALPSLRCRPYAVSPLQLLARGAAPPPAAEFFARWQALPHRARIGAAPAAPGALGVARVLAAIEAAGLACVHKALPPPPGGALACFWGAAWGGEAVAVVVAGALGGGAAAGAPPLALHLASDAAGAVAHARGHEADLLDQLTGGAATPWAGAAGAPGAAAAAGAGAAERDAEADAAPAFLRPGASLSFLRGFSTPTEGGGAGGADADAAAAARRAAAARAETEALAEACVAGWAALRAAG
jgi:hypothetical protein